MRALGVAATILAALTCAQAHPPGGKDKEKVLKVYGIEANFERYPQKTPQEALKSVLTALDEKRIDYFLAFLADPEFVKARLKGYRSDSPKLSEEAKDLLAFQQLIEATAKHFRDDPSRLRELHRFVKDGEWNTNENPATVTLEAIPERKVFLKNIDDRWYMMDRDK